MSMLGGIDTKFGYLALLDPKLWMKTWSAAAILDFTLQWPYATDFQKAPPGLLKGMVRRIQIKRKTAFTSNILRAYMAEHGLGKV